MQRVKRPRIDNRPYIGFQLDVATSWNGQIHFRIFADHRTSDILIGTVGNESTHISPAPLAILFMISLQDSNRDHTIDLINQVEAGEIG